MEKILSAFQDFSFEMDQKCSLTSLHVYLITLNPDFPRALCGEIFKISNASFSDQLELGQFLKNYQILLEEVENQQKILEEEMACKQHQVAQALLPMREAQRNEELNSNGIMKGSFVSIELVSAIIFESPLEGVNPDPFVSLEVEGQKCFSECVYETLSPEWNEPFSIEVTGGKGDILLSLMHFDVEGNDILIGDVKFPLRLLAHEELYANEFDVLRGGVVRGKLRLNLEWMWSIGEYVDDFIAQFESNMEEYKEKFGKNKEKLDMLMSIFE